MPDKIQAPVDEKRVLASSFRACSRSLALRLLPRGKEQPVLSYALSVGTVAAGTVLRLGLDRVLQEHHPFTIYFAAVAITAWYGGFGPALVALFLSYFAADWFFVAPRFEFNWPHSNLDEFMALLAFLFSGLAIAITSKIMREALARARQKQKDLEQEILVREKTEKALQEAEKELRRHAALLEQKVNERTANLRETIHSLEGVCYHIAHDLRAPLRAVSGYVSVFLTKYQQGLEPVGIEYLTRVSEAASRMDLLIHGLLDYGRLGHGEYPLLSFNPRPVLQRVLETFEAQISANHAEIRIGADWPAVWANVTLLDVVLTNLLSNALKFVPPGAQPCVAIWSEAHGEQVRICFEDRGIGIPPQYLHRAFQIFERLHVDESYPGTGIGLAIAVKAAERMAGRIEASSTPGEGSRFWLELRAGVLEESSAEREKVSAQAHGVSA